MLTKQMRAWFLFCILWNLAFMLGLRADPVTNSINTAPAKYAPLVSTPLILPPGANYTYYTNAHDSYEQWLLVVIADTKLKLQQTNLNGTYRNSLEWLLSFNEGKLTNYQTRLEEQSIFVKSVQSNHKTAWTNMPDPVAQALASDISKYEGELANTSLAPNIRSAYEVMLGNYKSKFADRKANDTLWANVRLAQQNDDQEQLTRAESQLADYLAERLGEIQGKKYPAGMGLNAVMLEYQKQVHGSHWFNRNNAIRIVILTIFLLPPLIILFLSNRRNSSK